MKLIEINGEYWVVMAPSGKRFGGGLNLDKNAAKELLNAMSYSFALGEAQKQREICAALGI